MVQPRVLVTAAAGKTGAAVVRQLRERDVPVRALVHRQDARSEALRRHGADVVVCDMFDVDGLRLALDGVRRAYYVPLFKPYATQAAAAFAAAAADVRLEGIVQLSQWLSHEAHPSILTRETWLIDNLLARIPGTAHVIVNPGMFADNFLRVIDFATLLHVFPVLTGDSKSAPVSNEDIARVATALLLDIERHAGMAYRPTGPALLNGEDMARTISRVTGGAVLPVSLPWWLFLKAARASGADIHEIYNFQEYVRDHKLGAFSVGGGVTRVVEQLTGRPAESFDVIAARYAATPFARPTLSNRLKALMRFMLLPALPGHDLKAYRKKMGFPAVVSPRLSAADQRWRQRHGIDETVAPPSMTSSATLRLSSVRVDA